MISHPRTLVQAVLPFLLLLDLVRASQGKVDNAKSEEVRLSYELILTINKGDSTRSELVTEGEVSILLVNEDRSFAWGSEGAEGHTDNTAYYLRIKASRKSGGTSCKRGLAVGFSGRVQRPLNRQVTWGENVFIRKKWEAFPVMSVPGEPYTRGGETVTPMLRVTVLKPSP